MARIAMWRQIIGGAQAWFGYWLIAAALTAGLASPERCLAAEGANRVEVQDIEGTVRRVQAAFERVRLVPAGRGTATVSSNLEAQHLHWGQGPAIVDFAFKGSMSRMDVFDIIAGERGGRRFATAMTDKGVYNVTPEKAYTQAPQGHGAFGCDFHPEVFLKYPSAPVWYWLETMLNPEAERKVEIDDDGIIHLHSRHLLSVRGEPTQEILHTAFDPNKGSLPVMREFELDYEQHPENTTRTTVTLDWAEYDTGWYVRSGRCDARDVRSGALKRHLEFAVNAFDPNAQINDQEFTLAGLTMPASSLAGKPLGDLAAFGLELDGEALTNKPIVVCFFNVEQRPSRNALVELGRMLPELEARGVVVLGVHAAKIGRAALDAWIKENGVRFPVGVIQASEDETERIWGTWPMALLCFFRYWRIV